MCRQEVIPVSIIKRALRVAAPNMDRKSYCAQLGIEVSDAAVADVHASIRKTRGIKDSERVGAVATKIQIESAAYKAGILADDVILYFNDKIVTNADTYKNLEGYSFDDATVSLKVARHGKLVDVKITR
jgi:S1-C subfamily serine protease